MDTSEPYIRDLLSDVNFTPAPGRTRDDIIDIIEHILSYESYVNIDLNDIITVLNNSSVVDIASATVPCNRIGIAISSMLRADQPGHTLSNVLINFNIGPDFTMEQMAQANEIFNSLNREIDVVWGITHAEAPTCEAGISVILGFK